MVAHALMSGVRTVASVAAAAVRPVILAAESGGSSAATGVLTEAMTQAIQSGFDSLAATVTQVTLLAVPVTVSVIALTGGVRYALKKVRGVIASAA